MSSSMDTIQENEISPADQFLNTQQFLSDSMYNLIPPNQPQVNENNFEPPVDYPQNVFDQFPYTTQQYMAGPTNSNTPHRASLPIIYDTHSFLPASKEATSDITASRRYTEGSLPKIGAANKRQKSNTKRSSREKSEPVDEQRRQFLERNRIAALKCRQRKKQWLADLQHRVEFLATDNEQLQTQATLLREEVINLKTLLLAHKDCKVAQANGTTMSAIQNVSSLHDTMMFPTTSTSTSSSATDASNNNNNYTHSPSNAFNTDNLVQF
ncbi:unnamed protein product [Rhizopus microsporus]